jgi:hypothetical protein
MSGWKREESYRHCRRLGKDQNDSLASADDLIESLRSGSYWSQGIRVDQEDRKRVVNSAVFQDSLAIRAGLIVVVVIALVGLASAWATGGTATRVQKTPRSGATLPN